MSLPLPPEAAQGEDTLYNDVELYEQILGAIGEREEVGCYASFAPHAGARILELGCGTGRLSQPLAERGFVVTGLDHASGMLSVARRKAEGRPAASRYVHADLREFELVEKGEITLVRATSLLERTSRFDLFQFQKS